MLPNRSIERRGFLKLGIAGLGLLTSSGWPIRPVRADAAIPPIDPDAALAKLLRGNQRFIDNHRQYPRQSAARLQEVAQAQHPFATILSCADSRVAAEIVFDQGIGDLFDVRIAGNIATPEAIGSIEYAVAMLGTPVLMVLGHERCGAVTAAVQREALPGEIGSFVKAILPAVDQVQGKAGNAIENAVVANIQLQVNLLQQRSAILAERQQAGQLKIVGGRYDLDSGRVTLI